MHCYLEHANLTVKSIDETVRFLTAAFPHFKVRGGGVHLGRRWIHIGTPEHYLALNEATGPHRGEPYDSAGFNHLGFVVDDAEGVKARLLQAGFREGFKPEPHPHRQRVYFHDPDGVEWEFVQYFSEEPALRNDYAL